MTDVVIIGAGPAGLSAAITCAKYDLQVMVIDEFIKPGGRLLGQLHQEPDGKWWNGIDEARKLEETAQECGVLIRCGVSVYHLEKNLNKWVIHTNEDIIETKNLLLATGAAEINLPVKGWTIPGVMSIGAAQVMTNVHRVRPGNRGMIIGLNVLSFAITRELQLAGMNIVGMVLPPHHLLTSEDSNPKKIMNSLLKLSHLAPSKFIQFGSQFVKGDFLKGLATQLYPKNGVKMWGIPIQLRKTALEIIGTEQVEAVVIADLTSDGKPIPGTEKEIEVDFVCIAGGLYPLAELAALAGCPFKYSGSLGGHVPVHNDKMETPLSGLFVAGNITGIESAKVAMAQGNVAGLSIVSRIVRNLNIEDKLTEAIEVTNSIRKNAIIQFNEGVIDGRKNMNQLYKQYV